MVMQRGQASWAAVVSCTVAALATVACGPGKEAQLKSQASADLRCPVEQVSREELQAYVEKVVACGKTNIYLYDHSAKQWVSPLDRAAFEIGCPKEQLTATPLDTLTVGVAGCGKKVVYVLNQTLVPGAWGIGIQNSWVANVTSDQLGPAPAPAPPTPAAPAGSPSAAPPAEPVAQ